MGAVHGLVTWQLVSMATPNSYYLEGDPSFTSPDEPRPSSEECEVIIKRRYDCVVVGRVAMETVETIPRKTVTNGNGYQGNRQKVAQETIPRTNDGYQGNAAKVVMVYICCYADLIVAIGCGC